MLEGGLADFRVMHDGLRLEVRLVDLRVMRVD